MRRTAGKPASLVSVYENYANYCHVPFEKPRYKAERPIPFIQLEKELETLMETCNDLRQRTALRLLYETGMRLGEIYKLQPKDIDFERKTVRVTAEKGQLQP